MEREGITTGARAIELWQVGMRSRREYRSLHVMLERDGFLNWIKRGENEIDFSIDGISYLAEKTWGIIHQMTSSSSTNYEMKQERVIRSVTIGIEMMDCPEKVFRWIWLWKASHFQRTTWILWHETQGFSWLTPRYLFILLSQISLIGHK